MDARYSESVRCVTVERDKLFERIELMERAFKR